jgi:two-component system sensor histidine kinase TctE
MARSLRAHLLRMLLPPIAALLALGAVIAYYPTMEPANEAYDQALVDIGIALGSHVRVTDAGYRFELSSAVEQVLKTDRYDTRYYRVVSPGGSEIAGSPDLPLGEPWASYDTEYKGEELRGVTVRAPCGNFQCTVAVAETTVKRARMMRDVLVSSLFPEIMIALGTVVIVWFGVKRGLAPLARVSEEIRLRSPRDLRPIDAAAAPAEARPLLRALNGLLTQVAEGSRSQQRFLANAAHQLRTPLAGLQAHTELALAQPMPAACRAQLEHVHQATIRTARLANQLLALARAEPGGPGGLTQVDLKNVVEAGADEWVHQALRRDVDLGFELGAAPVQGDAFLLREALANLVHNAIEYADRGGRVTVRTGRRDGRSLAEVEDDGPGIPQAEREQVLERFYRIPGTPGTGSGLGLAIVREIATGHGGAIELANGSGGRGCRVGITFPHG